MTRTNNIKLLLTAFFAVVVVFVLNSGKPKQEIETTKEVPFLQENDDWADSVLKTLSIEQKIAQLLIAEYSSEWKAKNLITQYKIGGFQLKKPTPPEIISRLQESSQTPLFIATSQETILFGSAKTILPKQNIFGHISDGKAINSVGRAIGQNLKNNGVNFFFGGYANLKANSEYSFGVDKYEVARQCIQLHHGISQSGILSASGLFPYTEVHKTSKKQLDTTFLLPFRRLISQGLPGMIISPHIYEKENQIAEDSSLSFHSTENILRKRLDFEALVISHIPDSSKNIVAIQAIESIKHGANCVINIKDINYTILKLTEAVESGKLSKRIINTRCKKVLRAKYWLLKQDESFHKEYDPIDESIALRNIAQKSFTVLENKEEYLPIKDLSSKLFATLHFGTEDVSVMQNMYDKYAQFAHFQQKDTVSSDSLIQLIAKLSVYRDIIISIDNSFIPSDKLSDGIDILGSQSNLSLISLGKNNAIDSLSRNHIKAFALSPIVAQEALEAIPQIVFGGISATGRLPFAQHNFSENSGLHINSNGRLRYSLPEEVGVESLQLSKIDSIAFEAIKRKATPGCQVLVAKDGAVVFEKSYGYHTFDKKIKVTNDHIYDLASITKIAGSTVSLMRLEDENKFDLFEPLQHYFPYLDSTDKGSLLLSDILTHQARLHPWIPFYLTLIKGYDDPDVQISSKRKSRQYSVRAGNNFYLQTGYTFRDSIISDSLHYPFTIEVARDVYMNKWYIDTMFCRIDDSRLREKNEYKYSDLGYYYIKEIIEDLSDTPMQNYTDSVFYAPLGAHRMGYLPLRHFSPEEIVPTEDDPIFRKQLLRGYVHDPGAAMLGGVGGHAGLFSNANDLAKMMQMLLNNGEYGGKQFLTREAIDTYTDCPNCDKGNRRGYGFDKPNPDSTAVSSVCRQTSLRSYGHTGFTGTITWVDPEQDLIYIFLSNRICPSSDNKKIYKLDIRPSIQRTIYSAINAPCIVSAPESVRNGS